MARQILKLRIIDLAHDGCGIGLWQPKSPAGDRGLAVFVAGALPGQTVVCAIARSKKNLAEAHLLEITGCDWQPPASHCANTSQCGGCPLGRAPYALQLEWKEKLAMDSLCRIGKFAPAEIAAIWQKPLPSPAIHRFRNKVEYSFGLDSRGQFSLGYRRRRSHIICPVTDCALVEPEAIAISHEIWKMANESILNGRTTAPFWQSLVLRLAATPGDARQRWHVICVTSASGKKPRSLVRQMGMDLLAANKSLATFTHEEKPTAIAKSSRRIVCLDESGKDNNEAAIISMPLLGHPFALDVGGFFQVNSAGADELARIMLAMEHEINGERSTLLDAYCGAGAPGLLLASRYATTLGVEYDKRAARMATVNAGSLGLADYRCHLGDTGRTLGRLLARGKLDWSLALLDPPRAGLSKDAMTNLLALAPANIIQISCNPVTMARDAAILNTKYVPARIAQVDLFPHTPYLESCLLWQKRA